MKSSLEIAKSRCKELHIEYDYEEINYVLGLNSSQIKEYSDHLIKISNLFFKSSGQIALKNLIKIIDEKSK